MSSKRIFQLLIMLVMLFSAAGSGQPVRAQTADPVIIHRDLSFWDATYFGYIDATRYEKWQFQFTATHTFTVTVVPIAGDLVPLLVLMNGSDVELAHATGQLTSTQPPGSYSIQIQPQSGAGFYMLTIREVIQSQASVSTVVNPTSINVGESALVTVSLNNIPVEGYTSAEFTCTYNASLVEVSNIAITGLFGPDAAVAISGPASGSFIVAIAGSNGNRAVGGGAAFTFSVTGLQAGQTGIECTARISKGDNILTSIPSTGSSLTITGSPATATATPTAIESPTATSSTPVVSPTPTATGPTPVESATPTATQSTPAESPTPTGTLPTPGNTDTPTATSTPLESPTSTFTSTPVASATPTALPNGTITGTVIASKPVTVSLYDASNALVTSVTANPDGTFSLTAPGGTYTIRATASGFLSAQGSASIPGGGTTSKPTITLLAGDIDGNNVIDQFDAMTIGMNYNNSTPPAADLNNDAVINVLDLELLAANYRKTGPTVWETSYP